MAWTTPRTWAAGEVENASIFNTHVRDNLNWLEGDTGWTAPTFQNSWTNYSDANFTPCGYRRHGPFGLIRGLAAGGLVDAAIFTLPVGYRPHRDMYYELASAQQAPRQLFVGGSGIVQVSGVGAVLSTTWVSLACIFVVAV